MTEATANSNAPTPDRGAAFQDLGSVAHCFGCGPDNNHGLALKSFWDGDDAVAEFTPAAYHCGASPDIVYGGLLACLIDCHACNLAIAYLYGLDNRPIGSQPRINCVTAQLNISLIHPTPIGETLHLRAAVSDIQRRKVWLDCNVMAGGRQTVRGDVLAVRLRDPAEV